METNHWFYKQLWQFKFQLFSCPIQRSVKIIIMHRAIHWKMSCCANCQRQTVVSLSKIPNHIVLKARHVKTDLMQCIWRSIIICLHEAIAIFRVRLFRQDEYGKVGNFIKVVFYAFSTYKLYFSFKYFRKHVWFLSELHI